jgi:hypothetical protein
MVLNGPEEHTFAQCACHRRDKVLKAALKSNLNVITDLEEHFYRNTGQIVNTVQLLHDFRNHGLRDRLVTLKYNV